MRKIFIRAITYSCILLTLAVNVNAQSYRRLDVPHSWSLGMTFGMSDLWGDVGTLSLMDHYNNSSYTDDLHALGGLFGRYTVHPALSLRLGINYGTIYATDKWNYSLAIKEKELGADAVQRYRRYQDAKTNIWEASLLFEIEPFRIDYTGNMALMSTQPVILVGAAYMHFQPFNTINGQWVKTADLHLEGDGFNETGLPAKVELYQLVIPIGFAMRFDIGPHLNLGLEYLFRMTFCDYLDGVSNKYIDPALFDKYLTPDKAGLAKQIADKSYIAFNNATNPAGTIRGNPTNNDSYSTISITLFYKVLPHKIPWWWNQQ